jgi:hypothetical protein
MNHRLATYLTLLLGLLLGACSDAGKKSGGEENPDTWNDMTWNQSDWG